VIISELVHFILRSVVHTRPCRWQAISVGKGDVGCVRSGISLLIFTYRRSSSSRVYGVGTEDDYFVMQEEAGSVLTWITPEFVLKNQTKENSASINKLQVDIWNRKSETQINVSACTTEGNFIEWSIRRRI